MQDWNVVVTAHEHGYSQAREFMETFGTVSKTDYFNVLALNVEDIGQFIENLRRRIDEDPSLMNILARVMPVSCTFSFQSPMEFENKAREAVALWLPGLDDKRFHVRMHRRGFRGRISSQQEERFLDEFVMEHLSSEGSPGEVSFDDPDVIIAVETIGQQAGLSIWTRKDRARYPFLKLD